MDRSINSKDRRRGRDRFFGFFFLFLTLASYNSTRLPHIPTLRSVLRSSNNHWFGGVVGYHACLTSTRCWTQEVPGSSPGRIIKSFFLIFFLNFFFLIKPKQHRQTKRITRLWTSWVANVHCPGPQKKGGRAGCSAWAWEWLGENYWGTSCIDLDCPKEEVLVHHVDTPPEHVCGRKRRITKWSYSFGTKEEIAFPPYKSCLLVVIISIDAILCISSRRL